MTKTDGDPTAEVDVLAIGAHPDDVEVGIGGLMFKLAGQGLYTGILDLTRGEMGTRGTPEERAEESAAAARLLGVARRANANLPDGRVADTDEQRLAVIRALREFRPRVLFAPFHSDRHPDHEAAHHLVRNANYLAGLSRIETGQPPHRAQRVYYYRVYNDSTPPQMVIDVTAEFDMKIRALRAYRSQFHNPDYEGKPTFVSSEGFWQSIKTRAEYWGQRIGVTHAEPLYALEPLTMDFPPGLEPLQ
jgi:bacillithiol biosynthesis deacetylase BshB1